MPSNSNTGGRVCPDCGASGGLITGEDAERFESAGVVNADDLNSDLRCQRCAKRPHEISEYVDAALDAGTIDGVPMTPAEYVIREEGTLNMVTGLFWCTECYIDLGMPAGKARDLRETHR